MLFWLCVWWKSLMLVLCALVNSSFDYLWFYIVQFIYVFTWLWSILLIEWFLCQSHAGLLNLCIVVLVAVNSRLIIENLMKVWFLLSWICKKNIHLYLALPCLFDMASLSTVWTINKNRILVQLTVSKRLATPYVWVMFLFCFLVDLHDWVLLCIIIIIIWCMYKFSVPWLFGRLSLPIFPFSAFLVEKLIQHKFISEPVSTLWSSIVTSDIVGP